MSQLPKRKKAPKDVVNVDGKDMNRNIAMISAGFIVDELPVEIVSKFLAKIGLSKYEDVMVAHPYLN